MGVRDRPARNLPPRRTAADGGRDTDRAGRLPALSPSRPDADRWLGSTRDLLVPDTERPLASLGHVALADGTPTRMGHDSARHGPRGARERSRTVAAAALGGRAKKSAMAGHALRS